jgi:hypothetical protein
VMGSLGLWKEPQSPSPDPSKGWMCNLISWTGSPSQGSMSIDTLRFAWTLRSHSKWTRLALHCRIASAHDDCRENMAVREDIATAPSLILKPKEGDGSS